MAHFKNANIEIEGLDELIEACANLPEDAMKYIKEGANEAGNIVLAKAKNNAPVNTGNLQSKLKLGKAKISSKYPYRVFSKITTAKGAAYLVPLELGHDLVITNAKGKKHTVGKVEERPFLRRSADESRNDVADILAKSMDKALKEFGGPK